MAQGSPHVYPMVEVTLNDSKDKITVNPDIKRGSRNAKGNPNRAALKSYMKLGDAKPG
jgi:hypothetical protein